MKRKSDSQLMAFLDRAGKEARERIAMRGDGPVHPWELPGLPDQEDVPQLPANPWAIIKQRRKFSDDIPDLGDDKKNLERDFLAPGNPTPYGPNLQYRSPFYRLGTMEPIPQDDLLDFWYGPNYSNHRTDFLEYKKGTR